MFQGRLAERVLVEKDKFRFLVDDVEFPWFITRDGIQYTHRGGGVPIVTLAFLAKDVSGIDVEDCTADKVLDFKGQYWKRAEASI